MRPSRQRGLDLGLAVVIAAMNVLWAMLSDPIPVVGMLLALPLVFVLPGYVLSEAMFHKGSLETSHRLLLSLALSLAIDILSGFILNFLPGGLQAVSWAVWLGVVTVVFALLAAFLRKGNRIHFRRPLLVVRLRDYVLFGLAIFVAMLSVAYSAGSSPMYRGSSQQPYAVSGTQWNAFRFTQLWMLPLNQVAPTIHRGATAMHQGGTCAVRIGVRSFEVTTVTYRVVVRVNRVRVRTWARVVLAPQQEWDRVVECFAPMYRGCTTTAGNVFVEVRLYRVDQPETVYRDVHVTLKCSKPVGT